MTMKAVVKGTLLTAVAQGATAGVAYYLLGVPFAVFLGALSGLLSMLPVGGTAIVWAPVALYLLLSGAVIKGIILIGVACRLLFEPGTNHYYTAGLAVGALVWDVLAGTQRWPLLTIWTVGLFELPIHLHLLTRHEIGLLRVLACLGSIAFVVLGPCRRDAGGQARLNADVVDIDLSSQEQRSEEPLPIYSKRRTAVSAT